MKYFKFTGFAFFYSILALALLRGTFDPARLGFWDFVLILLSAGVGHTAARQMVRRDK